jgi:hypothetical protein
MYRLLALIFLSSFLCKGQQDDNATYLIWTPEFLIGQSAPSNENFPDRSPQLQAAVNLGWSQAYNQQEWARRLKGPRTGLQFAFTDYGNGSELGRSYSLMPSVDFTGFNSSRIRFFTAMGVSYFDTKYDPVTNPNNQAITTDLVWSFRASGHYVLVQGERTDWRVGLVYDHHSNGHTRLPNQGFNSFLFSLGADVHPTASRPELQDGNWAPLKRSRYSFAALRAGYGINVLSIPEPFNDKKAVYSITAEYGQVYNNTFKWSAGVFYRFYQHYYDYIADNESLVQDGREFDEFKTAPGWNASNISIFGSGEVLLNHVGIEVVIGVNLHKPAYKIDWRINQGWDNTPRDIPDFWQLGEFDTKYRLKQTIATRMGLKYYLWSTATPRSGNLFIGAHINANLGQADYTELSLGYVYNFNFAER